MTLCSSLTLFLFIRIPKRLFVVLEQHIAKIRAFSLPKRSYLQCIEVLQIFGPPTRQLVSYGSNVLDDDAKEARAALIETFNKFVQEIDQASRQIQVRPTPLFQPL